MTLGKPLPFSPKYHIGDNNPYDFVMNTTMYVKRYERLQALYTGEVSLL